ncbi:hypothetical protein C8F04DRAFT_1139164 [Mycena alexandri]|uniref:Uncharacterized protein n=1 Tax=Mycena alexandri TaxID=1745969 RepID=A0AAD6WR27_9AGAR|nr:hypothetical protein C8F04DRAFT_1139164 [Mycena alexandri]
MLDAFKIKPFDLETVYASWAGPRFLGDPKKDPPVDDWLQTIKSGCIEHNVPKEYWHTCAQHFMGDKAQARLVELKKVMAQVHGGRYRWSWKKFKVAMRNMAWDIDTSETETVKVPSGPFWWLPKPTKTETSKPGEDDSPWIVCEEPAPSLSRSNTLTRFFSKDPVPMPTPAPEAGRPLVGIVCEERAPSLSRSSTFTQFFSKEPVPMPAPAPAAEAERPLVGRATTMHSFWPVRKDSKEVALRDNAVQRPVPRKAKSDGAVLSGLELSKALPPLPNSEVRAPAWLLNAATALDFLQNEHPRVMTTLSAILIVAGTIPSLPVITAGAGGAILASSTAHAVGAIAVGLGGWIKTQQELHDGKQGAK